MESKEIDWTLCFICQKVTAENTRTSSEGLETLSTNIKKFKAINALPNEMIKLFSAETDLLTTLRNNVANYHHSCRNKYNANMYKRAEVKFEKSHSKSTEEKTANTRHELRSSRESTSLGDPFCLFCTKRDSESNMLAAGSYHASKEKVNNSHLKILGDKWMNWALSLDAYSHVVTALSVGDLASNQFFYHKHCYTVFYHSHRDIEKAKSSDKVDENLFKSISLSKVASYLYEKERESPGTIYLAKELEGMYITLLKFHNVTVISHISRFTDSLIEATPGLQTRTVNNKVTVFFEEAIDMFLRDHIDGYEPDEFTRSIKNLVMPIRNYMKMVHNSFDGNFEAECQKKSVPIELLVLISMLIDGTGIENQGFSQEALTLSQLAMYNFRSKQTLGNEKRRHLKCFETPLPTFISLKIYASVRSRSLIDSLFSLGICLPYNRILDITKQIGEKELKKYELNGCFMPDNIKLNIPTMIAKDNIDLNARSTIVKSHFHGISMSVLQMPTTLNPGVSQEHNLEENNPAPTRSKKVPKVPQSYTEFEDLPHYDKSPLFAPVVECNVKLDAAKEEFNVARIEETKWLELMSNASVVEESSSWAKYHSDFTRKEVQEVGINSILPLIDKPVHTLKAQYHCMGVIADTIRNINPGQIPIDTCDQPVFALTKEVQWRYPQKFSDKQYFSILGGLHIEKELLVVHGEVVAGSGLAAILENNNLSLIGTSTATLDVNDIKRSRYCLQVSLCAIYNKLKEAHSNSCSQLPIFEWLDERILTSEMCFYWKMVFDMELEILIFVRSLREGNFQLYKESIWSALKWFFALDKYNYARWCTVHWFDLAKLPHVCPPLYQEMVDGNFSFQKTKRKFSRMALDQIHEQNNKVIKGVSGATHLLNRADESALSRWELCGPDLARLVNEFEEQVERNAVNVKVKHHEDNLQFQKGFFQDVQKTLAGMHCNPFEMGKLTAINNTSLSFNENVYRDISKLKQKGEEQLLEFVQQRLIVPTISIDTKINKNQLILPGHSPKTEKSPVASSTLSNADMTKLRSCISYRRNEVLNVFESEILGVSQCLSIKNDELYHGTKSDILKRFDTTAKPDTANNGSCMIIELSALIKSNACINVTTFNDYAAFMLKKILTIGDGFDRIDIVTDRYFKQSLKSQVRKHRGKGSRKTFEGNSLFPKNFEKDFLFNDENKEDLNKYLADYMLSSYNGNKTLVITKGDTIISNDLSLCSSNNISYCTSEEADPRLVRHAIHNVDQGFLNVVVYTGDTDVVILLISFCHKSHNFEHSNIYTYFVTQGILKVYNIKGICLNVGLSFCSALPFFYAFSGCDTVSSFFKVGKCKFYDALSTFADINSLQEVFKILGNQPTSVSQNQIEILQRYLLHVYYPKKYISNYNINEVRMLEFEGNEKVNLRQLPPSKLGLTEHIKRACYQAGWVWILCEKEVLPPDASFWGWKLEREEYVPKWQQLESDIDIRSILKTCSCPSAKCKTCSCSKNKHSCLPFCGCKRKCAEKET